MNRLISDLRNKDNQLYDACGNTWIYNNGDSNIPSNLVIPGPNQSIPYGFMTSNTNTKYIKLQTRGSIWQASASTMNEFTISITYKSYQLSGSPDGAILITPDQYGVPNGTVEQNNDQGFNIPLLPNTTAMINSYQYYPQRDTGGTWQVPIISNQKQVDTCLKDNTIWHELHIVFTPSKVLFFVNKIEIGYMIPRVTPFILRKDRGFLLGTWWYNPSQQTSDIEYGRLQVYEGIKYPSSNILKVY